MASLFKQRALRGIPDGASTAFSRAKKLASNAVKMETESGKPTTQGYEQAIAFLQQYVYSGNEKEALEAQGLVAGYENKWTILKEKSSSNNKSIGEFNNAEREIYFRIPKVNLNGDLRESPYDISLRISEIATDLTGLRFSVEERIIEGKSKGDDVSSFEDYLEQLMPRQETMVSLYSDYLDGNLSPQILRDTVGIYTESDNESGEIRNVGIMPIDNLPSDISVADFKRLDSSSAYGEGYLQEFGNFIKDKDGVTKHRQGDRVWDDGGKSDSLGLQYNTSSDKEFKNKPGTYQRQGAPFKVAGITPGKFSKGVVGVDENGKNIWKTFFKHKNNTIYMLDDETLASLEGDPNYAEDIENASVIYDTEVSRRMMNNEGVESLRFKPLTAGMERRAEDERLAPERAEQKRLEELGFWGRLKEKSDKGFAESESRLRDQGFFEAKNTPVKSEEPVVRGSAPDIIEKGKSFFRNNPLSKPFVEGFFGKK